MDPLAEALGNINVTRSGSVEQASDALLRILRPGDAVLVKASNSVGLAKLVARMVKGLACST
jgi:UDP-N-acetylmuramoyl-tripeptide--D-alanyl-D-alanine ligase